MYDSWGQYGMSHGGWHLWMGFHAILWALFVVLVILGIVVLVRHLLRGGAHRHGTDSSSALSLLDARYARGEIERDDYLLRKKDLT